MAAGRCCTLRRLRRAILQILFLIYVSLLIFAAVNHRGRVRYGNLDVFLPGHTTDHSAEMIFVSSRAAENTKKLCRLDWKLLSLQKIDVFTVPQIEDIISQNPKVKSGGHWAPTNCSPFQRVAIIIPYRDRFSHLRILLNRLHPMLRTQNISYRIFVIEQFGAEEFNRGLLMNIGYTEAQKHGGFDCFIFHDVDLVPEHDRNIYLCDNHARHLSSAIDETRYHVLYYNYLGGVLALKKENHAKINGYATVYWGWGQEDDDISARTWYSDLMLTRPPEHIGRYKMVRHKKFGQSDNGIGLFLSWRDRWKLDGLSSIQKKYRVVQQSKEPLYTNITVDIGKAPTYAEILQLSKQHQTQSIFWYLYFYFP